MLLETLTWLLILIQSVAANGVTLFDLGSSVVNSWLFQRPRVTLPFEVTFIGTNGHSARVRRFYRIPFAAAPVQQRRWSPPVAYEWQAGQVYDASRPALPCPQIMFTTWSENCLYLNIYTPSTERLSRLGKVPVLFWIYGGGFLIGDGYQHSLYDATGFVDHQDVIVVTHNYRLGALGFLVNDKDQGNFGIMDQRAALQWVHDYISYFGGDPDRVTLIGQSAGAISVGIHLSSPLSRGLFHKAVMMSNPMSLKMKTLEEARTFGHHFAKRLGCENQGFECLRKSSTWKILTLQPVTSGLHGDDFVSQDILHWSPVIDGVQVLGRPLDLFQSGNYQRNIPIILGFTSDEAYLMDVPLRIYIATVHDMPAVEATKDRYIYHLNRLFGAEMAEIIMQAYPPHASHYQNYLSMMRLSSDYTFECSTRYASMALAQHGTPVYQYEFSHASYNYLASWLGGHCSSGKVCHASDLPYFFGKMPYFPHRWTFNQQENYVATLIQTKISSFAWGDINADKNHLVWPLFQANHQSTFHFEYSARVSVVDNPFCNIWNNTFHL